MRKEPDVENWKFKVKEVEFTFKKKRKPLQKLDKESFEKYAPTSLELLEDLGLPEHARGYLKPTKYPNPEEFFKRLELSFIPQTSVRVRVGQSPGCVYDIDHFGFRSIMTQEWKVFRHILQNKGTFTIKSKQGEETRNIRRSLSKKLVQFFNEHMGTKIPRNHNLFQYDHETGLYETKFKVRELGFESDERELRGLSREDLFEHIKRFIDDEAQPDPETLEAMKTYLLVAVKVAKKKGWDPKNEIKKIVQDKIDALEVINEEQGRRYTKGKGLPSSSSTETKMK